MLPRNQRMTGEEVRTILAQKARIFHTPLFTIRRGEIAAPVKAHDDQKSQKSLIKSRFSIIIAKKVAKKATERNTIRRQCYEIIAKIMQNKRFLDIPPYTYLISVKKVGSFDDFSADLIDFFNSQS